MKALILVGGLGTRLRPLTINTPKAMMPVVNNPFIAHVIDHLTNNGADEIILTCGHLGAQMKSYFGDGGSFGVKITYVEETRPLGTAGAIKNCERYFDGAFFVLNGDIFSNIDLSAMLREHRAKGAVATIALVPVANPAAFGLVETESNGRIRRFVEKPRPDEVTADMINAGCYVLEPEILDYIPPDTVVSIERETFQLLLQNRRPFYGWSDRASYWIDMGNNEKYFQLNMDILSGICNCASALPPGIHLGDAVIADSARIEGNVVIGKGCVISPGAVVSGPLVLGHDCQIGANSILKNSIVWPGVIFGEGAQISGSIIGGGCRISSHNRITASVLADGVNTPANFSLDSSRIWPGTIISN